MVIPKHVYQTWGSYDIPKNIKEGMVSLRKKNRDFTYHFYDDDDCRDFIKSNFGDRVLNAYNTLKPGAYKADLWRYCIMYIKGGIYLDIKYDTYGDFKLNELIDQEYYVNDIPGGGGGIFNALLVSEPGNEIYKKCIDRIVENVENRYYGESSLEITGPLLLRKIMDENENYLKTRKYDIENIKHPGNCRICRNEQIIFRVHKVKEYYKNYKNHYDKLYKERKVYNDSAETATAASPSSSVPRPNVTTASVSSAPPLDGEAKDFGCWRYGERKDVPLFSSTAVTVVTTVVVPIPFARRVRVDDGVMD
jgi:mannosyltransferase OCH1-like enzyme